MSAILKADRDGFLTGGSPVEEVRRTRTDGLLFDIRTDVWAIRKAVQAGVAKTNSVMARVGSKSINDPSYASISRLPARPTGRLKGDGGSGARSGAAATAGSVKAWQATKARSVAQVSAGASAAMSPADQAREKRRAAVERTPVKAGERDARGRFTGGSNQAGSGDLGGGIDSSDSVASKFADKISQAVGGIGGVGDADPAVKAMQEVAEPVSRAYGALRGDKDARRQDGWFKRILKGLQRIEEKGNQPVQIEQSGTFALLGRFIPALLPVLAGLAATAAALAAYLKIEGYVSDGEKAKEGADSIKENVSDPLKEAIKPAVDTDKRAEEERARVLNARDGEYAKEDALKNSFVSPTGAAVGSKQWNDEFYKFSQAEIAKQEAEAKKGFFERSSDKIKAGAKAVADKASSRWDAVKGSIAGAAQRVGVDPGLLAKIAHFESGFDPNAAPIAKDEAKNRVRQYDGRMALSSAHGLGQFTDDTWLSTLRKHGGKHGVANASALTKNEAAKLRGNVDLQAAMLAELTRENAARGRALGGTDDAANVYALHNLGGGDGAKFLKALSSNPDGSVRDALISGVTTDKGRKRAESVIANNRSLYGDGSTSVSQAYKLMGQKMSAGERYASAARSIAAAPAVVVSAPIPPSVSSREAPRISDAPKIQIPLATSGSGTAPTVIAMKDDAGRDVSDRRIAHVVTGGIAGWQ